MAAEKSVMSFEESFWITHFRSLKDDPDRFKVDCKIPLEFVVWLPTNKAEVLGDIRDDSDSVAIRASCFVIGGLTLPLPDIVAEFLSWQQLCLSLLGLNAYRILNGAMVLARRLNVDLTLKDIMSIYTFTFDGRSSSLKTKAKKFSLVTGMPQTNNKFCLDTLIVTGDWRNNNFVVARVPAKNRVEAEWLGEADYRKLQKILTCWGPNGDDAEARSSFALFDYNSVGGVPDTVMEEFDLEELKGIVARSNENGSKKHKSKCDAGRVSIKSSKRAKTIGGVVIGGPSPACDVISTEVGRSDAVGGSRDRVVVSSKAERDEVVVDEQEVNSAYDVVPLASMHHSEFISGGATAAVDPFEIPVNDNFSMEELLQKSEGDGKDFPTGADAVVLGECP